MKYKYVIWDWNGTLLDDVNAALASVNDILASRNMPSMDIIRYREIIGIPIKKFYEKAFDLKKENYDELLRLYNEGYLRHLPEYGLTEGVTEALEFFKNEDAIQLILSSSNNKQLKTNVSKYGITEYFDAILGDDGFLCPSKTERAKEYLKSHNEGKVLVLGDLEHDADMAKEIGADCILLSTGHDNRERLLSTGAFVADSIKEITDYIQNIS